MKQCWGGFLGHPVDLFHNGTSHPVVVIIGYEKGLTVFLVLCDRQLEIS